MIRSRTVNKIHELAVQGKSIQDIAISLGIARNTVRKYLRHPELAAMPHPRPNRRSKLDPFKEQVRRWITEDHCYNCEAMLPRLKAFPWAICGPCQRCRRAPSPSMTTSVAWRC